MSTKEPSFIVGDVIKLRAEFEVSGTLTNPSAEVCTIEEPDGTDVLPSVTSDSTGKRSVVFTPDQVGYHHWRWNSTGTAAGRKEGRFYVSSSAIT